MLAIVLLAGLWRIALAVAMPCISRDGVTYITLARMLEDRGVSALRAPEFDQHPLYPAALLGAHRLARVFGATDSPLSWQRAGQTVSVFCGCLAVLATGMLARRLASRLYGPPTDSSTGYASRQAAGVWSVGLGALLPLSAYLSADVMSDTLHLALFLAAAGMAVAPPTMLRGVAAGALSGLAFLVRPEGAVIAATAIAALLTSARRAATPVSGPKPDDGPDAFRVDRKLEPWRQRASCALAVVVGFCLVAGPYWIALGQFSTKLDKQTVEEFVAAMFASPAQFAGPARAALVREPVDAGWSLPRALLEVLRAGRVVIPLLAGFAIWKFRHQLLDRGLLMVLMACATFLLLGAWLVWRHGYLDPRHLLPLAGLLTPLAAIALAALWSDSQRRGRAWMVTLLTLAPLAIYSARVPNAADEHLPKAADWLRQHDAAISRKLLLSGSSGKRIAFYAGMAHQPWPENEPDLAGRYTALHEHIKHNRPDYFAIEEGAGRELAGNSEMLDRLRAETDLPRRIGVVVRIPGPESDVVVVTFQPIEDALYSAHPGT